MTQKASRVHRSKRDTSKRTDTQSVSPSPIESASTEALPQIVQLQQVIGNSGVARLVSQGRLTQSNQTIQRDWLDDAGDWVSDTAGSAYDAVAETASDAYNTVTETASELYDDASNAVSSVVETVSDALGLDQIMAQLESVINTLKQAVESEIDGVLGGIKQGYEQVSSLFDGELSSTLELPFKLEEKANAFVEALKSPSDNEAELEVMWNDLKDYTKQLEDALPSLENLESLTDGLSAGLDEAVGNANGLVDGFIASGEENIASIGGTYLASLGPIRALLSSIGTKLKSMISSLMSSIKGLVTRVKAWYTANKKYMTKPWFWLDLISGGAYTWVARKAFKAAYSHYLPRWFIDNYIDKRGPIKLNVTQMQDCAVSADITRSTDFMTELTALETAGGGTKALKFNGPAGAATHGTMGNFTIKYNGTLNLATTSSGTAWSFNGMMNFYDIWDFDWKGFGKTHRGFFAELLTMIGDLFLPGEGFDITSEDVPVKQSDSDAEGDWSGKGVAGTPSRLFVEGEKEKGEATT